MVYDQTTNLGEFLNAAAARKPTPGGGAVAALSGALAASMAEMVLNYSVGKKGLEPYQSELKPALERVHAIRRTLEGLVVEDQRAYERMAAARKLPGDAPDRATVWAEAVLGAIHVPQQVTSNAVGLIELCDQIVNFVNPMLLSDLAVAADLAMAAARCGVYNVRINLPELLDGGQRASVESAMSEALMRGNRVIQQLSPRIWDRVELEANPAA